MGYPRNLLGEDEVIEFEMKPHWRGLIWPAICLILTVFVGVWLFTIMGNWDNIIETIGRPAVVIIALVLFGGSQLPKLARSLGEAQKELKKSMKDDDETPATKPATNSTSDKA